MKRTIVLNVNREEPEMVKIREAAAVIRSGGLVAFPTETVYGLGADALNPNAVARIYAAKKRPLDNPIIVHVARKEDIHILSEEAPKSANKLMEAFWPGPLTLVLKASRIVPKATTGGLETVAIRMPSFKVALALIRESAVPIAAPSANLAGKPSPTTAQHVERDLGGRIDLILDAGPTEVGVESTVLDLTTTPPQVLRPGGVPYEELKDVLGRVELHPSVVADRSVRLVKVRSPGVKHKHYAPNAEIVVVEGRLDAAVMKVQELADHYMEMSRKVGILATDETEFRYRANVIKCLGSRKDLATMARNLFRLLREFDEEEVDVIVAEGVPQRGLGLAVMNRLRKASGFNIVKVD
ncbi:MAG: L-threonylcarbamoyladenylate synthase [Candidatus Bathyarchaeota archaeon]|nr:L-threonylcarbamoyladenylate synthase [Candidatus Bathyarchaeota archaeon]